MELKQDQSDVFIEQKEPLNRTNNGIETVIFIHISWEDSSS